MCLQKATKLQRKNSEISITDTTLWTQNAVTLCVIEIWRGISIWTRYPYAPNIMLKLPVNNYDHQKLKETSLSTFYKIFHSITHSHISFLLEDPFINVTSKQHLSSHIICTALRRQKCSNAKRRSGIHSTLHSTFQSAKHISS